VIEHSKRFRSSLLITRHSWDLGMCLPDAVLAFLSKKQTCLGSLSLVTDGSCLGLESQDTYLSLVLLTRLRHLSWRALQSVEEFDALAKILQGNVEHLEELELDLLDWIGANEQLRNGRANRSRNRFARDVLKLEAGKRRVLFPRLSSLSLSAVSFRRSIKDMASAFNFDRLQTLKLRNCPGTNALLEMLVDSHQTIRLTSLELVVRNDDPESSSSTPAACRFLEMFDGLKDLFVLVHGPERTTNKYWDAVLHHKPTLKRVVYHEREVDLDDESPNFGLFADNMLSWDGSMFDLFRGGNLEYVGLCDSSVYLVCS